MLRPFFPFYGSKWRDARRYPAPGAELVEPFAGSAGYACYWEPAAVELVDLDPVVVEVWRYLIRASSTELLELPDLEPGQSTDELAVPQEARWLIGFWLNRGSAQPKKQQTAFSRRTERGQLVWSSRARQRLAWQVGRIRHWCVRLGSYESCELRPATWFVDPPYIDKGRYYRCHEVDHAAIGAWCRELPGPVIVCEQAGAAWLPFVELASIKSTRGRSAEVVYLSSGAPRRGQLELCL